MQRLQEQKSQLQEQLVKLEANKTQMDAVKANVEASDASQEDKDFALATYDRASKANDRGIARVNRALTRVNGYLARYADAAVKAKVDKIVAFVADEPVDLKIELAEDQLYRTNDAELDRLVKIIDSPFAEKSQKVRLMTGRLL